LIFRRAGCEGRVALGFFDQLLGVALTLSAGGAELRKLAAQGINGGRELLGEQIARLGQRQRSDRWRS
jgi:hypothetical protein